MTENNDKSEVGKISPLSQFGSDPLSVGLDVLAKTGNYNRWIYEQIAPNLGKRVVEVGSGIGNITGFLTGCERLDCIEPYEPYFTILDKNFASRGNMFLHNCRLEDVTDDVIQPGLADSVICLNVLEHIEDDIGAITAMKKLLAPGGRVVLVVPAMKWLYGSIDRNIGHYRRYTVAMIENLFGRTGLRTLENRYFNLPGSMAWWWTSKLLKTAALSRRGSLLYDKFIPVIKKTEKILPVPFGLSILAVGKKCIFK